MYFPTTHWSLLAKATLDGESQARAALEELCRRYWLPLKTFIRSRGYPEAEAEDLTQEFLLHLVAREALRKPDRLRGKFRSFLLGALVKFLANAADRTRALKRGGGINNVHLDVVEVADANAISPDALVSFDREWATTVLANAFTRARDEFAAAGRSTVFSVLQNFLPGPSLPPGYEAAASRIGCSVPALKSEVHRLRLRFRALIREEVAATVSAPHEIEAELAHLQSVLMDRGLPLDRA